ncbi:FAD-dependent oxidoreductase [Chelativorans composti]|uniref:NAD(P)/FAD-dependent oxidoreductase n=1 Tax=Chelativorans composti TaxID=768533 RepID=A0ABW5DEE1_9HYPH|nr:FAD-dependent oxidoreductase [bacterium SGD-2]
MSAPVVIIGASHGGVQVAASLRQLGFEEEIILFSAENVLPYHRPPLSKAYLAGEKDLDQILLKGPAFYEDHRVDLRLADPVEAIDLAAGRVRARSGEQAFSKLVIATGSRPRLLKAPGHDLRGIFTLRTLSDVHALKEAMAEAQDIVIVGGGFIGLEFASTAAKLGKTVTVIEAREKLLMRSLPATVGDFIRAYHAAHNVRFHFNAHFAEFEGESGRLRAIRLADGTRIPADMALVGIGGEAELTLAAPLGLKLAAGGIEVDEFGRTSIGNVYALGDVAAAPNLLASEPMRLESVQNAVDQAKAIAAHILGQPAPAPVTPWFWTDQYDLKVQMAGLSRPDAVQTLRGDPDANAFSVIETIDGKLVAVFSVNRAADHMAARRLIAEGAFLDLSLAADAGVPLMKAVKSS